MPDRPWASRKLRLVDLDVPPAPDPFAAPTFCFADPDAPVLRAVHLPRERPPVRLGHPTGPAPRADRPDTVVVWPSVDWLAHYAECPVAFPDWWLDMVNRGIPYSSDADESLQQAVVHVNKFKGHPPMQAEPLLFTRQAVLDALSVAPAPVTSAWVKWSLSAVSGIVRWVHNTGQPLTREHVFSEETRYRYKDAAAHKSTETARHYSARLELIGDHLNGAVVKRLPRTAKDINPPIEPLTLTEEADLWAWTRGVRPLTSRQRVQAHIALGLGIGLTRAEGHRITSDAVDVRADGVHVTVTHPDTGATRVVTCRREWEERLAALTAATKPGHYLMSPWSTKQPTGATIDQTLSKVNKQRPPVLFSTTRLRNTWLCHHLSAGVPLKTLLEASGMKEPTHLADLLRMLPPVPAAEARASLRGAQ